MEKRLSKEGGKKGRKEGRREGRTHLALAARYSLRHPHGRGSKLKEALLMHPRHRRQEGGTAHGGREGGRMSFACIVDI